MQEDRERWMQLAKLAASEQDPRKLMDLVTEINFLLEKKADRLAHRLNVRLPDQIDEK